MQDESAEKILSALESGRGLPILSPVAMKLVELASENTSSARDLVDLIEKDPPLAARLLKLANSVLYHSRFRPLHTRSETPSPPWGGFARRLANVLDPNSEGGTYAHFILDDVNRLERILFDLTNAT